MAAVTLNIPDKLQDALDEIIVKRKNTRSSITDAQRHEALRLCETEGLAAGNAYLRSVGGGRISRTSCIIQAVAKWVEEEGSKVEEDKAPAVPKKLKIPPKPLTK